MRSGIEEVILSVKKKKAAARQVSFIWTEQASCLRPKHVSAAKAQKLTQRHIKVTQKQKEPKFHWIYLFCRAFQISIVILWLKICSFVCLLRSPWALYIKEKHILTEKCRKLVTFWSSSPAVCKTHIIREYLTTGCFWEPLLYGEGPVKTGAGRALKRRSCLFEGLLWDMLHIWDKKQMMTCNYCPEIKKKKYLAWLCNQVNMA